jgi:hypothetical protein
VAGVRHLHGTVLRGRRFSIGMYGASGQLGFRAGDHRAGAAKVDAERCRCIRFG